MISFSEPHGSLPCQSLATLSSATVFWPLSCCQTKVLSSKIAFQLYSNTPNDLKLYLHKVAFTPFLFGNLTSSYSSTVQWVNAANEFVLVSVECVMGGRAS